MLTDEGLVDRLIEKARTGYPLELSPLRQLILDRMRDRLRAETLVNAPADNLPPGKTAGTIPPGAGY